MPAFLPSIKDRSMCLETHMFMGSYRLKDELSEIEQNQTFSYLSSFVADCNQVVQRRSKNNAK